MQESEQAKQEAQEKGLIFSLPLLGIVIYILVVVQISPQKEKQALIIRHSFKLNHHYHTNTTSALFHATVEAIVLLEEKEDLSAEVRSVVETLAEVLKLGNHQMVKNFTDCQVCAGEDHLPL